MTMEMQTARRIVRDLASQDNEDDERRAAAGWEPSSTEAGEVHWINSAERIVRGWRQAAREAGDQGVIDAIDSLGVEEAATEYAAAVERIVSERAQA